MGAAGFDPTPHFDSAVAGVPLGVNVTGADMRGGDLILTFDVTTDLPGGPFTPGQLVASNGATPFLLYYADATWPLSSRLDGVSFLAEPGSVSFAIGAASYYFLVVGTNANDEGSYGLDSAGFERPTGSPTCGALTQEIGCP